MKASEQQSNVGHSNSLKSMDPIPQSKKVISRKKLLRNHRLDRSWESLIKESASKAWYTNKSQSDLDNPEQIPKKLSKENIRSEKLEMIVSLCQRRSRTIMNHHLKPFDRQTTTVMKGKKNENPSLSGWSKLHQMRNNKRGKARDYVNTKVEIKLTDCRLFYSCQQSIFNISQTMWIVWQGGRALKLTSLESQAAGGQTWVSHWICSLLFSKLKINSLLAIIPNRDPFHVRPDHQIISFFF